MAVEIPLGISPSQVAQLKTINFKALQNNSSEELRKLISAAKQDGVFYLDLTGNGEEAQVYDSVDDLYRLSQSIFDMGDEEKLQFDVDKLGHFKLNGFVRTLLFLQLCGYLDIYIFLCVANRS